MNHDSTRTRRRWWRWILSSALMITSAVASWLAWQARPKYAEFDARKTVMQSVLQEPEQTKPGGYLSQAVRVRGDNGLNVNLRVLRPADAAGRLPLMILLGGHRTGRDAVKLLGDPGPVIVAALDYPYTGPERPRGLPQSLATIPAARQALLDTPPAVCLALDWLVAQPWVDSARVELVGVSLGVPFAAVAGALEPRFRRVWLIHGGADNRAWIAHNLAPKVKQDWLRGPAAGLVWLLAHGPTLEPEHWAPRIAPRSLIIVGATEDRRLPTKLVEKLYAAAGEPKELIWTAGGHVDRRPEAVQQLLDTVRSRLGKPDETGGR